MIGALIGKLVGGAVKKGSAKAVTSAGKLSKKAAVKSISAVKKGIGKVASTAIAGAGLASLFGGGGAPEPTPEERPSETPQSQDSTQGREDSTQQSTAPDADPLISLQGLSQAISNVIPIFDDSIVPLKSEASKTAIVVRKDVPLENKLNNRGENVSVLRAGTYIETRVDQIANLFRITDALRSSVGILDVGLSDVAKRLDEINESIEDVIDENRKTKLNNERRRDEEQTEDKEKPSKLKERLGEAGDFVKAGMLVQLAKYSRALVSGGLLLAMNAFGEDSDEESVDVAIDEEGFGAVDVALASAGLAGAAVAAKKYMSKKAAAEVAEVAAKEGLETVAKKGATTIASQGAEVAAKEAVEKVLPGIAKKTIAKTLGKAVPGISWLVGGALAIYELTRGNYVGAALEAGGSIGGAATAIPAMVGVIANEVYHALYGDWPVNHAGEIVAQRMGMIKDSVSAYVTNYFESESEEPKSEEIKVNVLTKNGFKDLNKEEIQQGKKEGTIKRSIANVALQEIKLLETRNEEKTDELAKEESKIKEEKQESSEEIAETPVDTEEIKVSVLTKDGFKELTKEEIFQGKKDGTIKRSLANAALQEIKLLETRNQQETPVPKNENNGNEITTSPANEKTTTIVPIVMSQRKPKPSTVATSPAGSGFPSTVHDSSPSFRTRDSFVDVGYQS